MNGQIALVDLLLFSPVNEVDVTVSTTVLYCFTEDNHSWDFFVSVITGDEYSTAGILILGQNCSEAPDLQTTTTVSSGSTCPSPTRETD